MKCILRG